MKNLFLKIFLLSWVINTVVFFALFVVATQTNIIPPPASVSGFSPRARMARMPGDRLQMTTLVSYGREAVAIMRLNGAQAATAYLEGVQERSAIRIFLFDIGGSEILDRTAPEASILLAAKILRHERIERRPTGDRWVGTDFTTSDGARFVAVVQGSRSMATMFLRHPQKMIMRFAVSVIVAGIVALVLAFWIAHPVEHLRTATLRFAAGDLTARAGSAVVKRKDAIGDLGRAFNRMAVRIESLLTSQQRLLRDVSHELRSPLARLNVALGLAARHAGPDADDSLARIEYEAERLNDLIGQLLTLSRFESGQLDAERAEFDLAIIVDEIAVDGGFEAKERGCSVQVVRRERCLVLGVELLLRRAIENVLRNAIKYTSRGTTVEVEVFQRNENEGPIAVVFVRDHGSGVPEEQLSLIFDSFHRVEDARDRTRGGVGLGLAIAKRAVSVHGGRITASNAMEGGLVVEICVPARQDPGGIPSNSDSRA